MIIETASLSEVELSIYCREKGLYPGQIQAWKEACFQGTSDQSSDNKSAQKQRKEDQKTIKKTQV